MKKLLLVCLTALLSVITITACGQKGPLFLPGNPSEIQSQVPRQEQPKNEDDEDGDEEKPD